MRSSDLQCPIGQGTLPKECTVLVRTLFGLHGEVRVAQPNATTLHELDHQTDDLDIVGEFAATMRDLLEAVQSPGAMERVISAPVGEMPGETFARFVAFDGVVHGWDLASATGQTWDLPADVVAAVDEFARAALAPEMRDGDTFKNPTDAPTGATPIGRLAAFSGRSV